MVVVVSCGGERLVSYSDSWLVPTSLLRSLFRKVLAVWQALAKRRKAERLQLAEEAKASRMDYFEAARNISTSTGLQYSAFVLEVTTCMKRNRGGFRWRQVDYLFIVTTVCIIYFTKYSWRVSLFNI